MQDDGEPADSPETPETPAPSPRHRRRLGCLLLLGVLAVVAGLLWAEGKTSFLQSRILSREAARLTVRLAPGPSDSLRFPEEGPSDVRRGYALLPSTLERLTAQGFRITAQARWSAPHLKLADRGLFAIYREKPRAGLLLHDAAGETLYASAYPRYLYPNFDSIPPLVRQSLLYIENRELLDFSRPYRNPAVEWDRLAKAALDLGLGFLDPDHPQPGGSTLATQIEKFRHSPGGLTASPQEKLRQMLSASLRAYLDGPDTREARRNLVLEYVNGVPLAAVPGFGEVIGLGDGLWAWYAADFDQANRLLRDPEAEEHLEAAGAVFKQALSLFVAQRRPSQYLIASRKQLVADTESYVRLLAADGLISTRLRDAALAAPLAFRSSPAAVLPTSFVDRKAANAVRTQLLGLLALNQLYALDRIDLSAETTLDGEGQVRVARVVRALTTPAVAESLGLFGSRLLEPGLLDVIYSFTLYEATPTENLLRIQVDNWNQPLDINEGTKLDLGSTAKLRTLVHYLEIVADLHARYASVSRDSLRSARTRTRSRLALWALDHLAAGADTTLAGMLDAALDRTYSSDPDEVFFTAGGRHIFANFDREDDGKILSVREAIRNSVNLVFIRLMRDIVRYEIEEIPGYEPAMLDDLTHPGRKVYLQRFADKEGKNFLAQFYPKYQGKSPEECLRTAAEEVGRDRRRLTVLFRSVRPEADADSLDRFLASRLGVSPSPPELARLFETYAPGKFDLQDRGFLAHLHPLDLWLVSRLQEQPGISWSEVVRGSAEARQEAYKWLFTSRSWEKQDIRIRIALEEEAFHLMYRAWRRVGYPFDSLVPSYATAIGSSADRPAALAELMGILVNDGVRLPSRRLGRLHFAEGTPYETVLDRAPMPGERVLPPEVARAVRGVLVDVVENGTARRCRGSFRGRDGTVIPLGGKTGTGDHRFETYNRQGLLIESRVVNRAATFVFLIGDRFFGTITAYVPGAGAARYDFTSALPVQILARLAPELLPIVAARGDSTGLGTAPDSAEAPGS